MFDKVQMSPSEFASAVVHDARQRGFNALVIVEGKKAYTGSAEGILSGPRHGVEEPEAIENPGDRLTFADLHRYIRILKDKPGFFYYMPEAWRVAVDDAPLKYWLSIYDTKNQVNILHGKTTDDALSIANIVFNEDQVLLVKVDDNCIADYAYPTVISPDTTFGEVNWQEAFGTRCGRTIGQLLSMIGEDVDAKLKSIRIKGITFDDFRHFCDFNLTLDKMFYFTEPDGTQWALRSRSGNQNDVYMYYISKESNHEPQLVAGFLFYHDAKGFHCRIVPVSDDGKADYKKSSGQNYVVDCTTRIDVTDSPFVAENSNWHHLIGGKVNGLRIRKALWSIFG